LNAEIITVGTELLLGEIINTNVKYISEQLANIGVNVYYQSTVGDNETRLTESFHIAMKRVDLIILTGGLGPTEDDLTKEVISKAINKRLIVDEYSLNNIVEYFKAKNIVMTNSNKKEALIPEGTTVLKNNNGTAPGCLIEYNDKIIILLPGPPSEVVPMFSEHVLPYLNKKSQNIISSSTIKLIGIGEAQVEEGLRDLIDIQSNPTIATYAKIHEVTIRITAKGKEEKEIEKLIKPIKEEVYKRYSKYIYGEDENTLEEIIIKKLIQKNMNISCAESLTGGMLCQTLINYPSSSKVFIEGAVTYSDESKINRLGVNPKTLMEFGAVSKEVAIEMAEGIAKTSNTNIGVATTGIAGPSGATKNKPIGTVYIAVCINGKTEVQHFLFKGNRNKIRINSTYKAMNMIFVAIN
jgi:nicotinamide-nucleotide amidase